MVPKPLAIRSDSLLVKCVIAAAVYFVPQDAVVLTLGALAGRARSRNLNAPAALADPRAAVAAFVQARGLGEVVTVEGRSTWEVKLKNVYQ